MGFSIIFTIHLGYHHFWKHPCGESFLLDSFSNVPTTLLGKSTTKTPSCFEFMEVMAVCGKKSRHKPMNQFETCGIWRQPIVLHLGSPPGNPKTQNGLENNLGSEWGNPENMDRSSNGDQSHFGLFLNFQDDVFVFFPRWKILKIDIRWKTSERLGPVGPKCARGMNKTKKTYTFIDKRFQDGSKVSKVRILYEHKYHSRFVPGYHIFYFPQKYGNISKTLKDGELKPFRNHLCQGRSTLLGMVIPP